MNFKLLFLVSLATSALLTPVEKAIGQTVPQINVKEAQHLRCTVDRSKEHNQNQGAVYITVIPAQNLTQ